MAILNINRSKDGSNKKSIVFNYYLAIFSIPIPFLVLWLIPFMVHQSLKIGEGNSNSYEKTHYKNMLVSIVYYWVGFIFINYLSSLSDDYNGIILFLFLTILMIFMIRMLNGLDSIYRELSVNNYANPFSLGRNRFD